MLTVLCLDSLYELDMDRHRLRRVTGTSAPTPRLGRDGTWRPFEALYIDHPTFPQEPVPGPVPGMELVVGYGGDGKFTRLSTVVTAADSPRVGWGRGLTLADPATTDSRFPGVVLAGNYPILYSARVDGAFVAASLLTLAGDDAYTASTYALGLVSAADPYGARNWSALTAGVELGRPGLDGWRRPWRDATGERP